MASNRFWRVLARFLEQVLGPLLVGMVLLAVVAALFYFAVAAIGWLADHYPRAGHIAAGVAIVLVLAFFLWIGIASIVEMLRDEWRSADDRERWAEYRAAALPDTAE